MLLEKSDYKLTLELPEFPVLFTKHSLKRIQEDEDRFYDIEDIDSLLRQKEDSILDMSANKCFWVVDNIQKPKVAVLCRFDYIATEFGKGLGLVIVTVVAKPKIEKDGSIKHRKVLINEGELVI